MHNHHEFWLWVSFSIGMLFYMMKRAYYLVTGPNPVATSYGEFIQRCWIPLAIRAAIDCGVFSLLDHPNIVNPVLSKFGIAFQLDSPISTMPGGVAFFLGLGMDSIVDFLVTKIPLVKDFLPQMPPALKDQKPSD